MVFYRNVIITQRNPTRERNNMLTTWWQKTKPFTQLNECLYSITKFCFINHSLIDVRCNLWCSIWHVIIMVLLLLGIACDNCMSKKIQVKVVILYEILVSQLFYKQQTSHDNYPLFLPLFPNKTHVFSNTCMQSFTGRCFALRQSVRLLV